MWDGPEAGASDCELSWLHVRASLEDCWVEMCWSTELLPSQRRGHPYQPIEAGFRGGSWLRGDVWRGGGGGAHQKVVHKPKNHSTVEAGSVVWENLMQRRWGRALKMQAQAGAVGRGGRLTPVAWHARSPVRCFSTLLPCEMQPRCGS